MLNVIFGLLCGATAAFTVAVNIEQIQLDEIGNCAVGQGGTETSVGFAAIGVVFKNDKPIGYACAPNMIVIKK